VDLVTGTGWIVPGEILLAPAPVRLPYEETARIVVVNTGDRPIQVGSHYHFAEANRGLRFDRRAAWGCRLAIPAGTSARFEPGLEQEVGLTPLGGRRVVPGLRGLAAGPVDAASPDRAGGSEDSPPGGPG
jgi:urease subunit beta